MWESLCLPESKQQHHPDEAALAGDADGEGLGVEAFPSRGSLASMDCGKVQRLYGMHFCSMEGSTLLIGGCSR